LNKKASKYVKAIKDAAVQPKLAIVLNFLICTQVMTLKPITRSYTKILIISKKTY